MNPSLLRVLPRCEARATPGGCGSSIPGSKRVPRTVTRLLPRPGTQEPIPNPAPPGTSCKEKHLRRCRALPRHPSQSSKRRTPSSRWPCSWDVLGCGTHQGHGNGGRRAEGDDARNTQSREAGIGRTRRAQPSDATPPPRAAQPDWRLDHDVSQSELLANKTTELLIGRLLKLRLHNPEESPESRVEPQCLLGNVVLGSLGFPFGFFF